MFRYSNHNLCLFSVLIFYNNLATNELLKYYLYWTNQICSKEYILCSCTAPLQLLKWMNLHRNLSRAGVEFDIDMHMALAIGPCTMHSGPFEAAQ
jgi:hypothetical protein